MKLRIGLAALLTLLSLATVSLGYERRVLLEVLTSST
jgi:hypothetical protein